MRSLFNHTSLSPVGILIFRMIGMIYSSPFWSVRSAADIVFRLQQVLDVLERSLSVVACDACSRSL
jgi:hypothetical protein